MNCVKLNEQQQQAFEYISDLIQGKIIRDKDTKWFVVIDAPAGTGKTFLIHQLYEMYSKSLHIITPTHKARSLFPSYYSAQTIHRFFCSHMDYDENGEEKFVFGSPSIYAGVKLIIVDEASMLTAEMVEHFSKIHKLPILFTCDKAQLPPVAEEVSTIYDKADVNFTLTQNMRSGTSRFAEIVDRFRHNVFHLAKFRINQTSLMKHYSSAVDDFKATKSAVVLTWTNKRRMEWNTRIRTELFGDRVLKKVYLGERLMFSGFRDTKPPEAPRNVEYPKYYSSDIITVMHLEEKSRFLTYEPSSCSCPNGSVRNKTRVVRCRTCGIEPHRELGFDINFYVIQDEADTKWYLPKDEEARRKIDNLLAHQRKYILAHPPQERIMLKMWKSYYNFRNTFRPDLDYIYALTTHKAQGSEWDNVYVDFKNISWSHDSKDRLLYTAASRMRINLAFIDGAAPRAS